MDAEEAASTGAHAGEFNPDELRADPSHSVKPTHRAAVFEDLQVPGGMTDPLWYMAAQHLAPKRMNHTDRLRWIEGFVACMELLRGVNVDLPGVSEVLLETISLEANPESLLD